MIYKCPKTQEEKSLENQLHYRYNYIKTEQISTLHIAKWVDGVLFKRTVIWKSGWGLQTSWPSYNFKH